MRSRSSLVRPIRLALATSATAILVFTALSLSGIEQQPVADAAGQNDHRIIAGLAGSGVTRVGSDPTWHSREGIATQALDLDTDPQKFGAGLPGHSVFHQNYKVAGQNIWAFTVNHAGRYGSSCSGIDVLLYADDGNLTFLGEEHYSHITPGIGVTQNWLYLDAGWNVSLLGWVAGTQPAGCQWTAAHLHQSGTTGFSVIYHNDPIDDAASRVIRPTSDTTNNWLHKVCWPSTGC